MSALENVGKRVSQLTIACAVVVGLLLTAEHGAAQSVGVSGTAEQVYKNIKVLQGSPADSFNQAMHLISGALGVNCEYCHKEMDFVSDEVKKKDAARGMITMTAELNQRVFQGKQVITCYTCHQGNAIPRNTPLLPLAGPAADNRREIELPSAAEVLSKYIAALGGEQNLKKITTRLITAEQDVPTGPGGVIPAPAQVEVYEKAPNLLLRVAKTKQATLLSGFDGTTAWSQDARGRVAPLVELESVRERRSADFYEPLEIVKEYSDLKVEGIEKVGAAEAYVVVGQPSEGIPVRLYFDTKSGLLLRRFTVVPTSVGDSPFEVDYEDYRDAGSGVKYPFRIHMEPAGSRTELGTRSTLRVEHIQENVAIDAAKFIKAETK
jgi:Photosynthetic reaction centre cytochrome C subunit